MVHFMAEWGNAWSSSRSNGILKKKASELSWLMMEKNKSKVKVINHGFVFKVIFFMDFSMANHHEKSPFCENMFLELFPSISSKANPRRSSIQSNFWGGLVTAIFQSWVGYTPPEVSHSESSDWKNVRETQKEAGSSSSPIHCSGAKWAMKKPWLFRVFRG